MNRELRNVEINKIFVLNPRERNKQIAKEIRQNIEDVGLKRPITISKKAVPQDGYEYDLVCGQGRLEAYMAKNQTTKLPRAMPVLCWCNQITQRWQFYPNWSRKNFP